MDDARLKISISFGFVELRLGEGRLTLTADEARACGCALIEKAAEADAAPADGGNAIPDGRNNKHGCCPT